MPISGSSAGARAAEGAVVAVLLPLPLAGSYDYRLPPGMGAARGCFVHVPLGAREVAGVVWGPGKGAVAREKLKDVIASLEAPPLTGELCRFVDWVANYNLAAPGAVLRMTMSAPGVLEAARPHTAYTDTGSRPERMTAARARLFDALADGVPRPAAELARAAAVSPGVIRALAGAGHLRAVQIRPEPDWPVPDADRPGPALSAEQQVAAEALGERVAAGRFSVTLLDGVAGAGKTEVYFEAIAATLRAGRQVLVLLPEIALGAQWLARFEARFGARPAPWHSGLAPGARRSTWRALARGRARLVVGARSALFLPFSDLGLIVVDEEHDASYKQEDGVIYNGRDMAVVRARLADIPIVLVSATPALETHYNVAGGRYHRVHLGHRHGGAALPAICAIDMRRTPPAPGKWLSPALAEAVPETLAKGEQAMLFLNRRGYAPLTLCRACGYRLRCPNCTTWLVEHRLSGALHCHHCGFAEPLPAACPECGAAGALVAIGPGVERLAEEAAALVPGARIKLMTSDSMTGARAAEKLVEDMLEHRIDLLIGTQMVTKGHHFPALTLVGVVDADLGLSGGDLRAAERSFQLLSQVAGRAGRADRPGRVLVQSYLPEHPVIRALVKGDREGFVAAELAARRAARMPPYGRLAALIVSAREEGLARAVAVALARKAPRGDGVEVLGPAPAPLAQLRGRHRFRLLVKAARRHDLPALMRQWLGTVPWPRRVRVRADIDPYSFM